jgi:serine phosphatase RsbU (regulator of sigma subunit)
VRTLRRSLMPAALPEIPGCELGVRFLPARSDELVGGDFYDVFGLGPRRWALVVGDVCGKGAEAATVTAMARWTLRTVAMTGGDGDQALRGLNTAMLDTAMLDTDLGGRFITLALVVLTLGPERVHASVLCAGHPPPTLVPAEGAPQPVPARGTLLGVWRDIELAPAELELAPGDSLVLNTDGVTDTGPGPEPVPARLLGDHPRGASADELARTLERAALQRPGPRRDDVAILAVRYLGVAGDVDDASPAPAAATAAQNPSTSSGEVSQEHISRASPVRSSQV